jgi:CRISPR system Cascade subunit CasC
VALFGRMMSANQQFSVEAAAQVAHAITVHKITVEDDYFSAVDDLNVGGEDAGAGHIGTNEFAAGLYYLYVVIDQELLLQNLGSDKALAEKAIRGLVEAACTVSPTGKKATFASFARASYALAERGSQQPRGLSTAFLRAVQGEDFLSGAIQVLKKTRDDMDKVYGPCADKRMEFDVTAGTGSLKELVAFTAGGAQG